MGGRIAHGSPADHARDRRDLEILRLRAEGHSMESIVREVGASMTTVWGLLKDVDADRARERLGWR